MTTLVDATARFVKSACAFGDRTKQFVFHAELEALHIIHNWHTLREARSRRGNIRDIRGATAAALCLGFLATTRAARSQVAVSRKGIARAEERECHNRHLKAWVAVRTKDLAIELVHESTLVQQNQMRENKCNAPAAPSIGYFPSSTPQSRPQSASRGSCRRP